MKIKYSTKFILEKRKDKTGNLIVKNVPVYMDFTFNGQRLRYYTGYRIDVSQWDYEAQKVKKNTFNKNRISYSIINQKLADIQSQIENIYIKSEPHELIRNILRDKLKIALDETGSRKKIDIWQLWEQFANDYDGSHGYKKHLLSTKKHLKTFCELNNIQLSFKNCGQEVFEDFLKYLKIGHSLNTVSGIMKRVNTFLNYSIKNNWLKVNPLKNIDSISEKYGDPIFLTKEERDYLYSADVAIERLAHVRDIFIFQCLIGCRVFDLFRLTKENIIGNFIEYIPHKTRQENQKVVRVPLVKKAKKILHKYDLPGNYLLPVISNQKYNQYIRELFQKVELDRPVIRLDTRTRQEEIVPLYKVASSHMARRTFIGILHKTEKNEVIASMSGHTENSKAFSRYYSVDDKDKLMAIKSIE